MARISACPDLPSSVEPEDETMDFRTCPACHASVLEDDVDDCPFCGASMSGKPSAKPKPAPAQPARKAAVAEKPAESPSGSKPKQPSARKPQKPEPKPSDEDADPFEVDTSAVRRAVKLAPRQTKTRTMEVICPMCETTGYLKPEDGGKDVQCANKECMVPVFKSPRPVIEEEPEEEPQSSKTWILAGSGVGLLALILGVWFFVLAEEEEPDVVEVPSGPREVTEEEFSRLLPGSNVPVQEKEKPPASLPEIRSRSLAQVVDQAQSRERNRNPDYGTQLAAETLAVAGQVKEAREQLARLRNSSTAPPYLHVQPLVEIAWQQIRSGQTDAATETAATALSRIDNAPASIRKSHDAAISLGALLVALNRAEDAQPVIRQHQDGSERGQVSILWRAAFDGKTYDIHFEARQPYHVAIVEPLRQGIVETLVALGKENEAFEFVDSAATVASRDACRAAWAGRLTLADAEQAVERVTQALEGKDISPAGRCRVWAAVASHLLAHGDSAGAGTALERAVASLDEIETRPPAAMPNMKQLYESEGKRNVGLPDPSPWRSAALAACDVALVRLQMGENESAWEAVEKSMEFARVMAPSPAATKDLYERIQKQEAGTRAQLAQTLNLRSEQTLQAFIRYRNQARKLNEDEAGARMTLQVKILETAAEAGLLEPVGRYLIERSQLADLNEKEPYLDTSLPGFVFAYAQASGREELANAVASASPVRLSPDPVDAASAAAVQLVSQGQLSEASERLRTAYRDREIRGDRDRLDRTVFRLVGQVMQTHSIQEAFEFIRDLQDPVMTEDAYMFLAGHSVSNGTAAELWKLTDGSRELGALDVVALYRGFVSAIPATKATPAPSADTAAE
jgi:hypothetical protein